MFPSNFIREIKQLVFCGTMIIFDKFYFNVLPRSVNIIDMVNMGQRHYINNIINYCTSER